MTQRSRDEIRATIFDAITTIAPEIDTAAIVTHQPLRDQIDLDSFDFLNVIVGLHERLGVDIPESDYGELATLDSAVAYLAGRAASRGAA